MELLCGRFGTLFDALSPYINDAVTPTPFPMSALSYTPVQRPGLVPAAMSRPAFVLLGMGGFLAGIAALATLVADRLAEIFTANPFFNGVILTVLATGIAVNLR